MNKKEKTQRGITLIALVITIIVMLILVGVTISMAVNGGLFNYAGKAVGQTNNALKAEQQLADGKIKVGETWYNNIGDYLNNIPLEGTVNNPPTDGGSTNDIPSGGATNTIVPDDTTNNDSTEGGEETTLIAFKFTDELGNVTTCYTEEGMTWGEWVEREDLNTINAYVGDKIGDPDHIYWCGEWIQHCIWFGESIYVELAIPTPSTLVVGESWYNEAFSYYGDQSELE